MTKGRGKRTEKEVELIDSWREIVRDLITETGNSQLKTACGANISLRTLSDFLNGDTCLSLAKLEQLLDFFGYDLEAVKRIPSEPYIRKRTRPVATRCTGRAGAM
ncbi:helix-turn-helix transcriptional regulator [Agrobacterium sp.]|uniref:helix-turn-helix domain-containing protein n=1 Tax=Agrobacterium sp. TaxID=361 RepID=UPI0028999676|nr:helix-turn-helix transcriptional regulator [Agrobacterium sp.]